MGAKIDKDKSVSDLTFISTPSSCFAQSTFPNFTENFNECNNYNDGAASLHDIDFLNVILPPSPESSSRIRSEIDDASSSPEILHETLKDQDIPNDLFKSSLRMNTFSTEDSATCYEVYQTNTKKKTDGEESSLYEPSRTSAKMSLKKKTTLRENDLRNDTENKKSRRSLKFPPCFICSGNASGLHYGAITCEACKGFFRRHLQKKTNFECFKGGDCEITSGKKGICSGCRLQKCLDIGMSKEKSKIGRYTLTKRTEAIIRMKKMEAESHLDESTHEKHLAPLMKLDGDDTDNGFNDQFVTQLVKAMDELEIYGPNVKTKEQVQECHRHVSEMFQRKIELFGKMGTVPKEEFHKLYKEFGIDIDGRIADMKIEFGDFEELASRYENFAIQIPGFRDLHEEDQSNLLKIAMSDFMVLIANDGYNDDYKTFVSTDGHGYHFDDLVNKFYSKDLITIVCEMYCCWQKLCLSPEETAIIGALTLVSADRCKLQNRPLVEKAQLSITKLLQRYIGKVRRHDSQKRFAKIMDALIKTREMSELFIKEQNIICNDALMLEEIPCIMYLFVEDTY